MISFQLSPQYAAKIKANTPHATYTLSNRFHTEFQQNKICGHPNTTYIAKTLPQGYALDGTTTRYYTDLMRCNKHDTPY